MNDNTSDLYTMKEQYFSKRAFAEISDEPKCVQALVDAGNIADQIFEADVRNLADVYCKLEVAKTYCSEVDAESAVKVIEAILGAPYQPTSNVVSIAA